MSSIDLGVSMSDSTSVESFVKMASRIGLSGIATSELDNPLIEFKPGLSLLKRIDLKGRGLASIKKQVSRVRGQSMILAIPLTSVEIANWASSDNRIDLLTLDPTRNHRLRESTARLAACSGTHLEIQFAPLFDSIGLTRSRIIKTYREAVGTAIDSGMPLVLSSGAKHPLHLRSAMAIRHIGLLLGMDSKYAETVVCKTPFEILARNQKKLGQEYVAEGIEIVGENDEEDS
ncbi:MAG: RNase P subunit p30 family protein [Candidatus Thorarchaeota archaeon]